MQFHIYCSFKISPENVTSELFLSESAIDKTEWRFIYNVHSTLIFIEYLKVISSSRMVGSHRTKTLTKEVIDWVELLAWCTETWNYSPWAKAEPEEMKHPFPKCIHLVLLVSQTISKICFRNDRKCYFSCIRKYPVNGLSKQSHSIDIAFSICMPCRVSKLSKPRRKCNVSLNVRLSK